jgi:AraC-like DNA-binding protein/mannose-6-phosphate isomerase-like protein (cupin superfamily)
MRNIKSVVSLHPLEPVGPGVSLYEPIPLKFNIWRAERIPGLEIIQSNRHEHAYPAHLHAAMEIIWIRSGNATLTCQNRTFEIAAGEAAIVPPNELHSGGSSGCHLEYVAFHLPRTLLHQVFCDSEFWVEGSGVPASVQILSRDKAASLLPIMSRTLCANPPTDRLRYILRQILSQILRAQSLDSGQGLDRGSPHPAVFMARSILRDQCADRVSISNLARSVDLDMRYLISLFKLGMGMPPHQFQIALRVDLAKSLIEQQLPLCEVAARAGFADQSHLNRHFRRQYGFTPGAFRKSAVMSQDIVL